MSGVPIESFSELVALSEAMLCCAQQGEWLQLADLEIKRRALIETTMQTPAADAVEAYEIVARRLLALDQRTLALALAGQANLAQQLQTLNIGRNAVQAYAQQSADVG